MFYHDEKTGLLLDFMMINLIWYNDKGKKAHFYLADESQGSSATGTVQIDVDDFTSFVRDFNARSADFVRVNDVVILNRVNVAGAIPNAQRVKPDSNGSRHLITFYSGESLNVAVNDSVAFARDIIQSRQPSYKV